jgi:hypothetical protein
LVFLELGEDLQVNAVGLRGEYFCAVWRDSIDRSSRTLQQTGLVRVRDRPRDAVGEGFGSPARDHLRELLFGQRELGREGRANLGARTFLTVLKGDEQWPHDRLKVRDRHSAGTYCVPTGGVRRTERLRILTAKEPGRTAAVDPDSAVGWLLVCRELGLLVGEISRVHRSRGELQRAVEIETDLHDELERIRARMDADRPEAVPVELDAETEAAKRAREPLGPATRQAPERTADVDDVDAVKRLIDPTRRRRPRQR